MPGKAATKHVMFLKDQIRGSCAQIQRVWVAVIHIWMTVTGDIKGVAIQSVWQVVAKACQTNGFRNVAVTKSGSSIMSPHSVISDSNPAFCN